MSVRLEMLQVARLAPRLLGDSAGLVRDFLMRQLAPEGGGRDRSGRSDLYYTVFTMEGLLALQAPLPRTLREYLASFGDGDALDFIHLCCLARCRAAMATSMEPAETEWRDAMRVRLEGFRSADGGYNVTAGSARGTAYGCFMALAGWQDLGGRPPNPEGLTECLNTLATPDGAWANEPGLKTGATNATAAAMTVLRQLGRPSAAAAGDWLLQRLDEQGGFLATPTAPLPDLLSTATALHALAGMDRDGTALKEPCLDFIDTLWTNEGGFHGHWGDDMLDAEYTFYGLLALGHLSL